MVRGGGGRGLGPAAPRTACPAAAATRFASRCQQCRLAGPALCALRPAQHSSLRSSSLPPFLSSPQVNITYWLVHFSHTAWKYFYFLLMYLLTMLTYTLCGQFLVFATPNQLMAQLLTASLNQLWTIGGRGGAGGTWACGWLAGSTLLPCALGTCAPPRRRTVSPPP